MNGGGRRKPPGDPGRAPPRPRSGPPAELSADRARALALTPVSRETLHRLDRFVATLLAWQRRMNLVAFSTEATLWTRHVADSLQLLALAPEARIWADLGSGGGFPGLVIACALADTRWRARPLGRKQRQESRVPARGGAGDWRPGHGAREAH